MNIVFWGTPKYAAENLISIVHAGFHVIAVITQPDRKRGRGNILTPSPVKKAALDLEIPVHSTHSIRKDQNTKELLFNLKADVYIVVAFGQILPKEILDQPKLGCWNSHASLLPQWRGAAPIQWSIINDDKKTGVCVMAMEEGLDTGPVIEQQSIVINDADNLDILSNKLSKLSSKLLIKSLKKIGLTFNLDRLSRLKFLNAKDQSLLSGQTSYARQLVKDDYLIDWNNNAREIIKKINGLYPNTFTYYNHKRIKLIEVDLLIENSKLLTNNINNLTISSIPGEVISINKNHGIIVMTKDLPILIKTAQLEGKKKTDGHTLSIQSKLLISSRLGS